MNIAQEILRAADRWGDRTALIDGGEVWSYETLVSKARRLGGIIRHKSAAPSVGILLPTCKEFYAVYLGSLLAGKIPVPINFLLQPEEIRFILDDAGADLVITAGPLQGLIPEATASPLFLDRLGPLEKMAALLLPAGIPEVAPEDPATILYTSGTTGRPKGVVLSHENLLVNARESAKMAGFDKPLCFLGVLPLFHSFALTCSLLIPLLHGGRIVTHKKFQPRAVLESIETEGIEVLLAVPSMYRLMLKSQAADPVDVSTVRVSVAGGEPLPGPLAEEFESAMGQPLLEGYGLTESSPVISLNVPGQNRPGTAGRPLPVIETRIVDPDTLEDVAEGAQGELWIRGPIVMKGYHHRPEETRRSVTKDGWLRTGDLCVRDEDGYLSIRGREKDLIIVAGENVSPGEIEEVLSSHPAVFEAAVLAAPDPARGEVPEAYVVLHEGCSATARELQTLCRERLAVFKTPKRVVFRESLPHGPTGKILKRAIQREPVTQQARGGEA